MGEKPMNDKKNVKFNEELASILTGLKKPTNDKKEWINIHDLIVGASYSAFGMLESDYINRSLSTKFLDRATHMKEIILKKANGSDAQLDKTALTWISGHHLSNSLHRLAWIEERMFYQILAENCSGSTDCKPVVKENVNPSTHLKMDTCKCAFKKSLEEIYRHNNYGKSFNQDLNLEWGPLNRIRNITNKQKHDVDRFEGRIKILGANLEGHVETILSGIKDVTDVFNHFCDKKLS